MGYEVTIILQRAGNFKCNSADTQGGGFWRAGSPENEQKTKCFSAVAHAKPLCDGPPLGVWGGANDLAVITSEKVEGRYRLVE